MKKVLKIGLAVVGLGAIGMVAYHALKKKGVADVLFDLSDYDDNCDNYRRSEEDAVTGDVVYENDAEGVTLQADTKEIEATEKTKRTGRPIVQMNENMEVIKRYDSISQASKETGVSAQSIRDVLKGKQKHAGGYIWKDAE